MQNNNKFKLAMIATAVSLAIQVPAATANDHNDEATTERIEVTGSHIRRTDMEGPSPLTSLSAEDIANTGVTDLIGLFTKLPISGQGTFSTQGNSSDDTANGGSSVSLRGLGADSTLILINGRRVSVSPFAKGIDTAFVDINNIPLAAIKRVDILKDGASATYGSDAIAGVINVLLKDDFDGVEVSAKYGDTSDGGGEESNLSILWGSSDEKTSHTFIMDYFDRTEVLYADRDYSRSANQAALTGREHATDFRSSSGIPGTIALASDPTNRIIDTFGNDHCPPEDIDLANNLCRYDYAPHMSLVPSTERFSFNYMGRYEINDSVRVKTELNGQRAKTIIRGAGSPSFNELFMSGDNVNHPFANDPTHEFHGQDLTMRRRTVDIGNREKQSTTDYYRAIVALEGEWEEWNWEAGYSYIRSESTERGTDGFPNSRRVQEAINSGLWNPFEPSSNTQEALDFIETTTTRVGRSTNRSFDFTTSGPIAEMEYGDLMLAFGAEYREETISDNPDDQFLRGEVFGTEATQANGERDNTSVFVEFGIPVFDSFDVQLAIRHEDYSDFGTTTDPKIAFLWGVNDDVSLRGSWGTAFRAPSLHQIGLGSSEESPNLVDTVRCQAVGLGCDPAEYTAQLSGNPDLGPEESESYNVGLIYQITDNLDFSLDYYSYDIEDIITKDTQFVFSQQGLNPEFVQRIPTSNPNDPGEVVRVFDRYANIGDLETTGIDLDINYKYETSIGIFDFSYVLNYVIKYEDVRPALNDAGQFVDRIDTEEGGFEQPEYRWTFATSWTHNDWNANLAVNYIGEFEQDDAVRIQADGTVLPDVDSMTTVDTTINYIGFENTTLTLGITNLFDEEPPFSYHDFMGFVSNIHSGQGRFAYVQATYRF